LILGSIPNVFAQSSDGEPAEIVAEIPDTIPSIQVSNWTSINMTIIDASGINWTKFQEQFLFFAKVIWPISHPSWRPYLGYTSLRFEPEIISGNTEGWHLDITPSSVSETTTGYHHPLVLRARTDDSAVDYSVVVGIKCTRYDTFSEPMGESIIYIPLKAAPANFIEIGQQSDTTRYASPKSMVYFDLSIKNTGYYKDTFQFDIETENDLLGLFEQQVVTMDPGETKQLTVGILTPEKMFDPGTPNQIRLYVKSSGNNSRTLIGNFVVMTQGMYLSPIIGLIAAPIIIFIILIYLFFYIIKDRKERELYGKPDKPWLIPEEKKYLDELKEKDKKQYSEVMSMMRDEYTSALLFYESYKDTINRNVEHAEAKGGVFDRLTHLFKKSGLKDNEPAQEENKTAEKVKTSKKSSADINDSGKVENKSEGKPEKVILSSPLKGFMKKIPVFTKKKDTNQKGASLEKTEEQKEVPKKEISEEIDPDEQKLQQEQQEKIRKKEEAMKKIKKDQLRQRNR
jgi:hypothetical protein